MYINSYELEQEEDKALEEAKAHIASSVTTDLYSVRNCVDKIIILNKITKEDALRFIKNKCLPDTHEIFNNETGELLTDEQERIEENKLVTTSYKYYKKPTHQYK